MKNNLSNTFFETIQLLVFSLLVISFTGCSNSQTEAIKETNFNTDTKETVYSIDEFGLPTDWSDSKYLELEMKISSPERVHLVLYTSHGSSAITLLPAANAWIRLAVPLQFYIKQNTEGSEMAALFSRSRTTGWFNIWGVNVGSLNKIDSIGFRVHSPAEKVKLEIRSISLTNTSNEKFIDPKVMVDKFGQWIPAEWEDKVENIDELKTAWEKDDLILNSQDNLNRDKFGGLNNTQQKVTGFFYKKKIDGKWWFIDPLGNLFLATGINGVSPGDFTRTENRKYIFAEIPPKELQRSTTNIDAPLVSYGQWNQQRRFGDDWKSQWKKLAIKRMKAWGLTAINWSVPELNDTVVYAKFLKGWGIEEGVMGMPDIYSQSFLDKVDLVAKEQCLPLKNDPWLLGYFIGNEPVWPGMESRVVDAILESDKTPEMKKILKEYLKEGDTPERRKEFIHNSFIRFLKVINSAIKKYDSNHLTLGIRFGGDLNMEDKVIKMANVFDVFSFNAYLHEVSQDKLNRVSNIMDCPILIGEFHFGVAGRGLAGGLEQVKDQKERGKAYRHYVENAISHPNVVSTFWYRWRDQPNTGRNDGENYNIGLVDVTGLVYHDLTNAIRETHSKVFDIHLGKTKPYNKYEKK